MRKGNMLEPFAYVTLNPKLSKEKHKGKAVHSLKGVVKGVKKGTLRGQKARAFHKRTGGKSFRSKGAKGKIADGKVRQAGRGKVGKRR